MPRPCFNPPRGIANRDVWSKIRNQTRFANERKTVVNEHAERSLENTGLGVYWLSGRLPQPLQRNGAASKSIIIARWMCVGRETGCK